MALGRKQAPGECSVDEMVGQWRLGFRLEGWRAKYAISAIGTDGDNEVPREPRSPSWSLLKLLALDGEIRRAVIRLKIQERLICLSAAQVGAKDAPETPQVPLEMPAMFADSVRCLWLILDERLTGMRMSRLAREGSHEDLNTPGEMDSTKEPIWLPLDDVLAEARETEMLRRILERRDGHIELADILAAESVADDAGPVEPRETVESSL